MDYISGWCKSERRLDGCTVIVTGSNTGVGKETALDLYKRGACVIMGCRNVITAKAALEDMEESTRGQTGTGKLVVEELDLCSLNSVRDFVSRVTSHERELRVLVCNAGVMMSPEGRTQDGFETHIGSNHLGHALLTLLLLPLLIRSAPSRIVFVSSDIHFFFKLDFDDINFLKTPYAPLHAYSNSKTANILFAKALDKKLKEHNIKGVSTYSVHPGIVRTGIGRHFPKLIAYGFQYNLLKWCWKSPRCGAQTSIYCSVDDECQNESGFYYRDCASEWPSTQCRSESEAEKLWNITINMLNLQDWNPFTEESSKDFQKQSVYTPKG